MKDGYLLASRIISMIFTPFYLPMVGLVALFVFSYLSMLPWQYKLSILLVVYVFTIFLPTYLIHLYRKYQGWSHIELGIKVMPSCFLVVLSSGFYCADQIGMG